jgi:hypothetical protein
MTVTQALAFIYVCSEADTRTGIWNGSAKSLSGELGIPERTARDVLEKMEDGGYIRRFAVPGRHSCYPILVHKFLITDGEHFGEQLDALNSIDASALRYLPAETREQSVERGVQHGVEHGAAQKRKRIEKEKERKRKAQAPEEPSPSVFSGVHFSVSAKQDQILAEAFPWGDRVPEYRKADSWLEANPNRRPRNIPRFLHNWFSRSSNRLVLSPALPEARVGLMRGGQRARLSADDKADLEQFYQEHPELRPSTEAIPA